MSLTALICALAAALAAYPSPALKVVCHGDSITMGVRLMPEERYPAVVGRLLGVESVNAGIGGNTSSQGLARLEKDVLAHKPAAVVLFFGTNDSAMTKPATHKVPLEKYEANLRKMVEQCRAAGAKVAICTLPPIIAEPYFARHPKEYYEPEGGLPAILERYRAAAQRVGQSMNVPVADLYGELSTHMDYFKTDGVHPDAPGTAHIARLVAEKLAPLLNLKLTAP